MARGFLSLIVLIGMGPPAARLPRRIVIVGGGFAAVEALLALRALLRERAQITLVATGERFAHRSATSGESFNLAARPVQTYSLTEIAGDAQARFLHGRVEAVAPAVRTLRLDSGTMLRYDSLILALGARARAVIPGALTFRGQRDLPQILGLLSELRERRLRQIVFAIPSGCAWPLPLYELAMLTAAYAEDRGVEAEISLVSPAYAPLEIFGAEASEIVRRLLVERGVRFVGSSIPASIRGDGALQLHFGGVVPADQVVCSPQLLGPRVAGVPGRWWGFVPVDGQGRVEGLENVYAAGDMTSFPVKQGGAAAHQAEVIASVIAAEEGAKVQVPLPTDPGRAVEARLLRGAKALAMRARLEASLAGRSAQAASVTPLHGPMHEKASGRYLNAYLAERRRARRRAGHLPPGASAEDTQAGNGV